MNRSRIEMIKATVVGALALLSLLLVLGIHDYSMGWLPVILGLLTGWFGWKANYFSRNGQ